MRNARSINVTVRTRTRRGDMPSNKLIIRMALSLQQRHQLGMAWSQYRTPWRGHVRIGISCKRKAQPTKLATSLPQTHTPAPALTSSVCPKLTRFRSRWLPGKHGLQKGVAWNGLPYAETWRVNLVEGWNGIHFETVFLCAFLYVVLGQGSQRCNRKAPGSHKRGGSIYLMVAFYG